jgi:hypothetical protein
MNLTAGGHQRPRLGAGAGLADQAAWPRHGGGQVIVGHASQA